MGTQVTNIKIHFSTNVEPILNQDAPALSYTSSFIPIIKLNIFTYSIMGKSKNFVNMTGAPTLSQVEQGILLLLRNSNVQYIYNVKIDSISMLKYCQLAL